MVTPLIRSIWASLLIAGTTPGQTTAQTSEFTLFSISVGDLYTRTEPHEASRHNTVALAFDLSPKRDSGTHETRVTGGLLFGRNDGAYAADSLNNRAVDSIFSLTQIQARTPSVSIGIQHDISDSWDLMAAVGARFPNASSQSHDDPTSSTTDRTNTLSRTQDSNQIGKRNVVPFLSVGARFEF